MNIIKDLWNRNKDKIFIGITMKGGEFMLKKIWRWIWKSAKTRAIELVKAHKLILVDLIKKYADPEQLADKIIDFICEKIRNA